MLHAECPLPGVLPSLVFAVQARIGFPAHPFWLGREWIVNARGPAQAFAYVLLAIAIPHIGLFILWSQLQNVGGLKRLAGFCASQAGIFGNFRNFWRCCVDFGRSFSVACPRLTELNCQR